MNMTEIRRSVPKVPATSESTVTLAEDAASVLGYKVLQQTQKNPKATMGSLTFALAELAIEVLDPAGVKAYQGDHMKEVARRLFEEWLTDRSPYRTSFYCPNWRETKIEEYGEPIPEFVLNKAVQIKKAVPECKIIVEYLDENPDPFLLVKLGDEKHCVEVWAEPKFEGKL